MSITIEPIHPLFGARIGGPQICQPLDDDTFGQIRAAFDQYSVLVFRDQHLDDEGQIAFSRRFGELQQTQKVNPGVGTYFARQSNLDLKTNEIIPPDDRRMLHAKANMLWHTDSSYRPVPSLCSLLSGHVIPAEGGNTEFASTRAAYDDLPEDMRRAIVGLQAEHSLAHSRSLVDPRALTDEMRRESGSGTHLLTRINPVTGRKSVFLGAHASHIIGWPIEKGRALIRELNEFITQPKYVYSHAWRVGDMVLWDNRSVLHRATPFDIGKHHRVLQRTTVIGNETEYRQERERLAA